MSMYRQFLNILQRYGRTIVLKHGEQEHFVSAYITPFTYANRQYLNNRYSIIGKHDKNTFLYIGSPENGGGLMCVGDLVQAGSQSFLVTTCELLQVAEQPFYMWGILRHANEEV